MRSILVRLLLLVFCVPFGALAQTITIGLAADVTSIDPHFHVLGPNQNIAEHVFETLVAKDARQRLKPGLAESWRAIDDTTWEVKLRRGVKFHDGSDFTAEDVVFSLARPETIKNSPSSFTVYTKAITGTQVVDPLTMRLRTAAPYPLMPNDLSVVPMVSKKAATGASTEDFNAGKAAVGTGPYKFVRWAKGDRIEIVRNDPKRERLLQAATEIAVGDLGIIPLYHQVNVWATRKAIGYTPRTDERTYAFELKPR